MSLIDSILSLQGLELLLQNLTRLDEKNEVSKKKFFLKSLNQHLISDCQFK
jgi:hypothetical protein